MIFKFYTTIVFLVFFFVSSFNSVSAQCTNIITIQYPSGCESVCLPDDPGCIECTNYQACIGPEGEPPANYDGYCYENRCACPDGDIISYLQSCDDVVSQSCGDAICSSNESCSSCSTDCGDCASQFCGDTMCTGFESCLTCSDDCGICDVEQGSWWQVKNGLIGSNQAEGLAIESKIPINSCVPPACDPSLSSTDVTGNTSSVGYVLTSGGSLKVNGGVTTGTENIFSVGTGQTKYYEYFNFFLRGSQFGLAPTDDFTITYNDALKPNYNPDSIEYYRQGDLTIISPWHIYPGESYIIYVDGDLYLEDGDGLSDELIQVDEGGFLAFIVSGNMYVDESLGNSDLNDTTANIEGVFIVNGIIQIQSRGAVAGGDDRFIGEGTFVGWNGVELERDFDDTNGRDTENLDKPTEQFIYRPDFMVHLPDEFTFAPKLWQQTQ